MQQDPTNQDLMHFITDIRDDLRDIKEKDLPEINSRVKVTNGSVADIRSWKERITGAGWALGLTITFIVIPLLTWAFISVSKIPDKIHEQIKEALSAYNLELINETNTQNN